MADVKWVKLSVNLYKDRKVRQIRRKKNGDTYALIWIMLLCLAGDCNDEGRISAADGVAFNIEDFADEFGVSEKTMAEALTIFDEFGMIVRNVDNIRVTNWDKHQNTAKLETLKQSNAERQRRYRENLKERNVTRNVTRNAELRYSNGTDIDKDIDIDKDTEEEQDTFVTYGNSGNPKKEQIYNQAYLHSPRARAATAQIIIDNLSGLPAVDHPRVHDVVCHALEIGAKPEEIEAIGRKCTKATEFVVTFMAKEKWNA